MGVHQRLASEPGNTINVDNDDRLAESILPLRMLDYAIQELGEILDQAILPEPVKRFLPKWYSAFIYDFLELTMDGSPISTLIQGLNAKVAQIFGHTRLSVLHDKTLIPANYYGVTFMQSGGGKDKLLSEIDRNLLGLVKERFHQLSEEKIAKAWQDTLEEATENLQTKIAQDKHVEQYGPRSIKWQFSDGTAEGLLEDRVFLQRISFGGTFFQHPEFADYLSTQNNHRKDFLSVMIRIFDLGNSDPKTTKGQRFMDEVSSVPHSMIAYSSVSSFFNSDAIQDFMTTLNRGLARRFFICFPSDSEFRAIDENETFQDSQFSDMKIKDAQQNLNPKLQLQLLQAFNHAHGNPILILSPLAVFLHKAYKKLCQIRASKISNSPKTEGIVFDMGHRSWRTLKLSCLIQASKNIWEQDGNLISAESYKEAVYITEYFGKYLNKFYAETEQTDISKLVDYMSSEQKINQWIPTTELRAASFVSDRFFTKWFKDSFDLIDESATLIGCRFQNRKMKGNSRGYEYGIFNSL